MFAFALSVSQVVIVILAGVATVLVAREFLRKDTAFEQKQRAMIKLSALLQKLGFKKLAEIAECVAIKDWSGVYAKAKVLVEQMEDPKQGALILEENFFEQLPVRLANVENRLRIYKVVDEYKKNNPEAKVA